MAAAPHVSSDQIEALRHRLYAGEQHLDAATGRRLLDEIDRLRAELAAARVTFAKKASAALEKRLHDVASFNRGGCPACREAEAHAFLAKLQRVAKDADPRSQPGRSGR